MKIKPHRLTLAQAIEGYLLDATARRLSPHTLSDYTNSFGKLQAWLDPADPPLVSITADQLREFFNSLAAPVRPAGIARRPLRAIGKKQLSNIHVGLSALWTWAVANQVTDRHILREITRPKPEQPAIVPYSHDDARLFLAACERTSAYTRRGRISDNHRPSGPRDRAIVLLLLDTGVRASELCGLRLCDVDLRNRQVTVWGKGSKQRMLPISAATGKALWRYITAERGAALANEAVFINSHAGRPLSRNALLQLLHRLGERAGVADVHPHRFRHTFAINYLRNGGNALALQTSLGHTTLEMVRTYLTIAEADLVVAHRTASPVENWRL
ncbi:MAG: tyrosine-type recombinase/integrase [Pseudomonadota bacterium]